MATWDEIKKQRAPGVGQTWANIIKSRGAPDMTALNFRQADQEALAREPELQATPTLKPNMPQGIQALAKGQAIVNNQQTETPTLPMRLGFAASGIRKSTASTLPILGATSEQRLANLEAEKANPQFQNLVSQRQKAQDEMITAQAKYGTGSKEYNDARAKLEAINNQITLSSVQTPVSKDAAGMSQMREALQDYSKATQGLTGKAKAAADIGISIADNLTVLPTALVNPAIPLTIMGAKAAAQKTYELNEQGASPQDALFRGLVSGGIEAATEKIPLDMLLKLGKEGSRAIIKNLLKQGGVEATEEGVSYALNYLADKLAKDPNAKFDWNEFKQSVIGGLASGLLLGGSVNIVGNTIQSNQPRLKDLTQNQAQPLNIADNQSETATNSDLSAPTPQTLVNPAEHEANLKAAQNAQKQVEEYPPEKHIDNRTFKSVGSQKIKAFQFDHPNLHQYFADAARGMLGDLKESIRGERFASADAEGYYDSYGGVKRHTTAEISALKDNANLSYEQIEKALQDIIDNHGQENYAAAKKVEILLNEMLTYGGRDISGESYAPNQEYINAKKAISGEIEGDYSMSEEDWNKARESELPQGVGAAEKSFDPNADRVAEVLTSSPKAASSIKQVVKDNWDFLKRKFSDSGATLATISKETGDKTLYTEYNNAKQASAAANVMIGEEQRNLKGDKVVGESLKSIFDPIRKKGEDYYKAFSEYMFQVHNIDRMAQEKPVFGETVTADMSKARAAELLNEYPEFKKYADQVYKYLDNLMQYRVDSGLISQKEAADLKAKYPFYVPTFRNQAGTSGATSVGNTTLINTGIKKATGSSLDLMPLHDSIARQTMQTVQAAKRNVFGNRLMKNIMNHAEGLGQYVYEVNDGTAAYDIDSDDVVTDAGGGFVFYENGKPISLRVSKGVEGGLKSLSYGGKENPTVLRAWAGGIANFKKLVTQWNLAFMPKNFARDIQDAGLYSKDLPLFIKNYPKAIQEIASNGEMWKKYKALGGLQASYFDFDDGYTKDHSKIREYTIDKIEQANMIVEQAPRLAEFMATLEKGDGSYENLMEAMYNAADVTVNFGRSGDWGKVINKYFTPFFNPSMQGFSKAVRRFQETEGATQWASLVTKAVALGVLPSALNAFIYKDDEDWKNLNQRDKDIYFLFKYGEHEWVKIPKGRVLSAFGMAADRGKKALNGEDIDWASTIKVAIDQTAPNGIISNSFVEPFRTSKLFDPNDPGKTWYGTNIESQRLQKYAPGERYDESTDSISKAIGGKLNISPKKLNYLLDSYSGTIGDFILPLLTQRAESNPLIKAFTIDSVTSNNISDKFYEAIDKTTYAKNSKENPSQEAVLTSRYLSKQSTAVSALYDEIRKIETSGITDKEKREKTREVRELITGIEETALQSLDKYNEAAKRYTSKINYSESLTQTAIQSAKEEAEKQGKKDDSVLINQLAGEFRQKEIENDIDHAYLMANKDVFGAEYALQTYNKDIYANAKKSYGMMIQYNTFFDVYFAQKDIKGDKNDDGNTISLSASINKKNAIDKAAPALNQKQKEFLYEMFKVSEKVWSGYIPTSSSTGLPSLSLPKLSLPKLPSLNKK